MDYFSNIRTFGKNTNDPAAFEIRKDIYYRTRLFTKIFQDLALE